MTEETPVGLADYQRAVKATDHLPPGLEGAVLGLFGETGSLLAAAKKRSRESTTFVGYQRALLEELGDVLWYFTLLTDRAGLRLPGLGQRVSRSIEDWDEVDPADEYGTFCDLQGEAQDDDGNNVATTFLDLAGRVGDLVNDYSAGKLTDNRDALSGHLVPILRNVIRAAHAADVSLDDAAAANIAKTKSRFRLEDAVYPPLDDADLPPHEQLPRKLKIHIQELSVSGKTYVIQKRNGVVIGDRLTDNKAEPDDYRFHDVFHIAYATHLGWSPVLRALLKAKRKSRPDLDEAQDGARAILIEEGVSTFVFNRALERDSFRDHKRLDYDLLKAIEEFVRGFEVQSRALWQWERAILDGYKVFVQLKEHRRGLVIADLQAHTLTFEPGEDPWQDPA